MPNTGEKNQVPSTNEASFRDLGAPTPILQTADEFEAEVILSKLKANGIPAFLQHTGFGSVAKVYCGRNNLSVTIMVPASLQKNAEELIAPDQEYDFSEVENMQTPPPEKNPLLPRALILLPSIVAFILIIAYFYAK